MPGGPALDDGHPPDLTPARLRARDEQTVAEHNAGLRCDACREGRCLRLIGAEDRLACARSAYTDCDASVCCGGAAVEVPSESWSAT
jgi:hypothetical protein